MDQDTLNRIAELEKRVTDLQDGRNPGQLKMPLDLITIQLLREAIGSIQSIAVGGLYFGTDSTNPSVLLGYGTWTAFGTGQVLVGYDVGQAEFNTLGMTGGEKTHTLSISEIPSHKHDDAGAYRNYVRYNGDGGGPSVTVSDGSSSNTNPWYVGVQPQGGGAAHNNLQPYVVVMIWKRTA